MGKTACIRAMALRTGMTDEASGAWWDAAITTRVEALQRGEPVTLAGFGRFEVRARAACAGRNPRAGETLSVPAATIPKSHAAKQRKEAVNS